MVAYFKTHLKAVEYAAERADVDVKISTDGTTTTAQGSAQHIMLLIGALANQGDDGLISIV